VVTGLALASPALFLLPGGIKGDIIPCRENLSGSLLPPGRPAYIYQKAAFLPEAEGRLLLGGPEDRDMDLLQVDSAEADCSVPKMKSP